VSRKEEGEEEGEEEGRKGEREERTLGTTVKLSLTVLNVL
jgi:hypothetical protein